MAKEALILRVVLDWIAKVILAFYTFIYHRVFQLPEPFTRIFCRMEQAEPFLFWGGCLFILYKADQSWWAIPLNLLGVWFIPHIVRYRINHPENTPFLLIWAEKRLIGIRHN